MHIKGDDVDVRRSHRLFHRALPHAAADVQHQGGQSTEHLGRIDRRPVDVELPSPGERGQCLTVGG
jgi:hypothetical protein